LSQAAIWIIIIPNWACKGAEMNAKISHQATALRVEWPGRAATDFPAIWLRDNCRCAACRHPGNGQRLYEITDLPPTLKIQDAARESAGIVRIVWAPDGHVTIFSEAWLAEHDLSAAARKSRKKKPTLWNKSIGNAKPVGDWRQMVSDPSAELAFLDAYHATGGRNVADYSVVSREAIAAGATPRTTSGAAAGIAASLGARHAAGAFGAREPGLGL